MHIIQSNQAGHWTLQQHLVKLQILMKKVVTKITHIYWEGNWVANFLANETYVTKSSKVYTKGKIRGMLSSLIYFSWDILILGFHEVEQHKLRGTWLGTRPCSIQVIWRANNMTHEDGRVEFIARDTTVWAFDTPVSRHGRVYMGSGEHSFIASHNAAVCSIWNPKRRGAILWHETLDDNGGD